MVPVMKSIGHPHDSFDLGVKAFTNSVNYPVSEKCENLTQIIPQHTRLLKIQSSDACE